MADAHSLYISETLAGEPLGLVEQEDGAWALWYGPVPLGSIGHNGQFNRPKPARRRCKPVPG